MLWFSQISGTRKAVDCKVDSTGLDIMLAGPKVMCLVTLWGHYGVCLHRPHTEPVGQTAVQTLIHEI
jgi:hypothetical protein